MQAACHPDRPNHARGQCRKCYYIEHRLKIIENVKRHYRAHTEERKQKIYEATIKRVYGITIDDFNKLLTSQHGVCMFCKKPPCKGKFKRLHIDHNHTTGKVRGLLCRGCNGLLGWYERNKGMIDAYLS